MSRVIDSNAFPSAVQVKLRRIRWRQIGLVVVRGLAIGVFTLIAAMLLAMLVDWWFTIFSMQIRVALTSMSLLLSAAVLLAATVRPLVTALGWTRAANEADAEVPQLEERWTTVSHFAGSKRQPETPVSRAMLQQVMSEAVALGRLVEPARVVRVARVQKVVGIAAASVLVLVGFLAVNWEQNSVLMRRFWAPTAEITATQLHSVTGDVAIPRGQAIDLVTRLTGMSRSSATLTLVTESNETSSFPLNEDRDAPDTFSYFVDVDESFQYRVSAGDGRTDWHSIVAIDPPEIAEIKLTVTAPSYVDRPLYEKTLLPGRVKAIQGSQLSLLMRSAAPVEKFELQLSADDEQGEEATKKLLLTADEEGWYRFETVLDQDLALSPRLYSPHGLTNEDQRVCRIRVIADKAPVARVISPIDEMSVSPDEVLDIKFEAHDDHGVAKAELVVYEETEDGEMVELSVQEIPLEEQQLEKHILAEVQLDLSKYDLEEGANISYAIRVTDNRELQIDPESVASADANAADTQATESSRQPENSDLAQSDRKAESDTDATAAEEQSDPPHQDAAAAEQSDAVAGDSDSAAPEGEKVAQAEEPGDSEADAEAAEKVAQGEKAGDEQLAAEGDAGSTEEAGSEDPAATIAESQKEGLQVNSEAETLDEKVAQSTTGSEGKPGEESSDEDTQPSGGQQGTPLAQTESPTETDAGENLAANAGEPTSTEPTEQDPEDADPRSNGGTNSGSQTSSQQSQLAQNNNTSTQEMDEASPNDEANPDEDAVASEPDDRPQSGSVQLSQGAQGNTPQRPSAPLDIQRDLRFEMQRGQQNSESNRLRLTITDRMSVAAAAGESRQNQTMNTRRFLERIDAQLEAAEEILTLLNNEPDLAAVPDKSKLVDARLEEAELVIAELRQDSAETKYEFVGLQMLDIGRTHVTPARDRMFVLIQDPGLDPGRNILRSLHHTSAAREALAALTKRFEAVARDTELAESLEEAAKMYEVYVENMRGVLREAQKNQNPLERKMAELELDEAYLDRLTQVLEMEREIMAEFARILAEDPRLMGKYMDIIKRRDGNLRNRLTDLHELQEEIAYEVSGWLRVDEAQRPDVWIQVAELRLLAGKDLVKAARQLEDRTLSQLPLNLEPTGGIGAEVIKRSKEVALKARQSALTANKLMADAFENDDAKNALTRLADDLKYELTEFDAILERLAFEKEDDEEVTDFTTRRLAESRSVAEKAIAWAKLASHIKHQRFHALAAVDQQQLAIDTERLRVDMTQIEEDLEGVFLQEDVPVEIVNIVRELMMTMETITFNQAAGTYELNQERLQEAEAQQTMATEAFVRAEELFDQMRRKTVEILDEREVRNPTAADLEDPSLDEFLERLEREPNIRQLLGIPNRPSNLRVIRDWMLWRAQGNGMGGGGAQAAANAAMQRAQMMAQQRRNQNQKQRQQAKQSALTEEELEKFARAEDMEEDMEKMLRAIEEKMKDPATSEEQRKELQQKAQMLAQMLQEAQTGELNREKWEELANADETRAMMEALAKGEPIPDSQWNRLLSTLDSGLWQVRGRTPPEDFRKQIEQYQDLLRRFLDEEAIDAN